MGISLNNASIVRHPHEVDIAHFVNPRRFRTALSEPWEGVQEIQYLICGDEVTEELPLSLACFRLLLPCLNICITFVVTVVPVFVRSDSPVLNVPLRNIGLSHR